jgi:hypothetical protein
VTSALALLAGKVDVAVVSLLHAAFLLAGESERDLPAVMAMVTLIPLHSWACMIAVLSNRAARRHGAGPMRDGVPTRRLRLARRQARGLTSPGRPVPLINY